MPEAVFSNSTPAFKRQSGFAQRLDASYIADKFDDLTSMLRAYGAMTNAVIDMKDAYSGTKNLTYGMGLLHSLIINDVEEFATYIKDGLDSVEEGRELKRPMDADLLGRIITMRVEAYHEAGRDISDNASEWSEDDTADVFDRAQSQHGELLAKLDGSGHLLDAGSLLPWLELKIRREVGLQTEFGTPTAIPDDVFADPKNLRDQFIAEKIKEGFSLAHISQAMNVKISAIERALKRLTETGQTPRLQQAG